MEKKDWDKAYLIIQKKQEIYLFDKNGNRYSANTRVTES